MGAPRPLYTLECFFEHEIIISLWSALKLRNGSFSWRTTTVYQLPATNYHQRIIRCTLTQWRRSIASVSNRFSINFLCWNFTLCACALDDKMFNARLQLAFRSIFWWISQHHFWMWTSLFGIHFSLLYRSHYDIFLAGSDCGELK